jgi:hypothetical protein
MTTDMTPEDLRVAANAACDKIRGTDWLTPTAKAARIAKIHLQAADAMSALEVGAAAEKKSATHKAVRTAFGLNSTDPATIASGRAARQQVEAIDIMDRYAEREAADLLETATQLGDEPLRQALALKAWESGWKTVLQDWSTDAKPAQIEALNKLNESEPFNAAEMLKFALPAPVELSGCINQHQIRDIAASDPDPTASPPASMESRVAEMNAWTGVS